MTVIVFDTIIDGRDITIATESWAATEMPGSAPKVDVHLLGSIFGVKCSIEIPMTDFLSIVSDAHKVLDIRTIQVTP